MSLNKKRDADARVVRKVLLGHPEVREALAHLDALEASREAVIRENNALRKASEELRREVETLKRDLAAAQSSARTAQTMAAHWRLQATGKADED